MMQKPPEQATACPLFAEWKLTDAVSEFGKTMDIPDTIPVTRIPLSPSLTDTIITQENGTRYLPLTITGWQRTRRGGSFFFGLEAVAGDQSPAGTPTPTQIHQTPAHPSTTASQTTEPHMPVHLPITPPAGYLITLRRMHRHGLPLTASESLLASALAAIFDRRRAQKNHRCRPLLLATDATRITLPDGGIYDLPLARILTREEATSEDVLRQSYALYRKARGYECTVPTPSSTAEPEIYLTADLHLGHRNAIHYYCRPFLSDDADAMDRVLTENWNHTVSPDDSVIFAGDFTYKAEKGTTDDYRSHLNGTITWIQGNHDTCLEDTCPSHTFTAGDQTFLVIHNPKHAPATYRGWVIHGHTHNVRLGKYPFISFTEKTVNVSTDVTGYRPVPLKEILALIREGEAAGRTSPILIREMPLKTGMQL